MIYTGKIIDANEAYTIKLVNKVVRLSDAEIQHNKPTIKNTIILKEKLLQECVSIAEIHYQWLSHGDENMQNPH